MVGDPFDDHSQWQQPVFSLHAGVQSGSHVEEVGTAIRNHRNDGGVLRDGNEVDWLADGACQQRSRRIESVVV